MSWLLDSRSYDVLYTLISKSSLSNLAMNWLSIALPILGYSSKFGLAFKRCHSIICLMKLYSKLTITLDVPTTEACWPEPPADCSVFYNSHCTNTTLTTNIALDYYGESKTRKLLKRLLSWFTQDECEFKRQRWMHSTSHCRHAREWTLYDENPGHSEGHQCQCYR